MLLAKADPFKNVVDQSINNQELYDSFCVFSSIQSGNIFKSVQTDRNLERRESCLAAVQLPAVVVLSPNNRQAGVDTFVAGEVEQHRQATHGG